MQSDLKILSLLARELLLRRVHWRPLNKRFVLLR
jgi:hypothetical protein